MEVDYIIKQLCKGPLFTRSGFDEHESQISQVCETATQPSNPILPGESAAISFDRPRTTALFFDKVWSAYGSVPKDIAFGGNTDFEKVLFVTNFLLESIELTNELIIPDISTSLSTSIHLNTFRQRCLAMIRQAGFRTFVYKDSNVFPNINNLTRFLGDYFAKQHSISATPIFSGPGILETEYSPGNKGIVIRSMSGIDILDETKISWPQVYEVRKDHDARRKLRRMMHWLDSTMIGKSASFIEDEIAMRLDDYHKSIRKHGLKTMTGGISSILGSAELAAAATVTTAVTLASTPMWGLLSGAGVMIGKVAVSIAEAAIDYDDVKNGPNTEIAFVYDLKKKFVRL